MVIGEGVCASVNGHSITAGNLKLLAKSETVTLSTELAQKLGKYLKKGCTVIYIGIDGEVSGYIVLSDTVREESADTIEKIKEIGITPVLLTGDNENAAKAIGSQLGITEIKAGCLPEAKMLLLSKNLFQIFLRC